MSTEIQPCLLCGEPCRTGASKFWEWQSRQCQVVSCRTAWTVERGRVRIITWREAVEHKLSPEGCLVVLSWEAV